MIIPVEVYDDCCNDPSDGSLSGLNRIPEYQYLHVEWKSQIDVLDKCGIFIRDKFDEMAYIELRET